MAEPGIYFKQNGQLVQGVAAGMSFSKADVGLANVDNTPDLAKPLSYEARGVNGIAVQASLYWPGVIRGGAFTVTSSSGQATGTATVAESADIMIESSGGAKVTTMSNSGASFTITRPASNSRIDLLAIVDYADGSGIRWEVIQGVAAAAPTVPSSNNGPLVAFAHITVPSNTNLPITGTDVRRFTGYQGSVITVPNAAARLRLPSSISVAPLQVFESDTKTLWFHNGTTWTISTEDSGWLSATPLNGWVNFGAGFEPLRYRKKDGRVYISAVMKPGNGSLTHVGGFLTLPVGWRPTSILAFMGSANAGVSELRVYPNGTAEVFTYYNGGDARIVGAQISFFAEQ